MTEWIVFGISNLLIVLGLLVSLSSVFGMYRFRFVINRMHATAMNDTLGILFVLTGLMIQSGISYATVKMLMIVIFFWFASPVSGHLISKMQVIIDEHEAEAEEKKIENYEVMFDIKEKK